METSAFYTYIMNVEDENAFLLESMMEMHTCGTLTFKLESNGIIILYIKCVHDLSKRGVQR